MIELHLLDKVKRASNLVGPFSGKPNDQRSTKAELAEKVPDLKEAISNFIPLHPSPHALQNVIVDVLNRKIEIGTDRWLSEP